MSNFMDSIKSTFSSSGEAEEEDEGNLISQAKKSLPKLSFKQRVIGFIIAVSLAALFSILGCCLAYVSLAVFAVFFTIGTLCGVASTLFLVGPIEQAKRFYDPKNPIGMTIKIVCAVTLLVMVVLVFCAAFWWKIPALSIIFCIIEFVAVVVYAITLIPFATTIISRGARSLVT